MWAEIGPNLGSQNNMLTTFGQLFLRLRSSQGSSQVARISIILFRKLRIIEDPPYHTRPPHNRRQHIDPWEATTRRARSEPLSRTHSRTTSAPTPFPPPRRPHFGPNRPQTVGPKIDPKTSPQKGSCWTTANSTNSGRCAKWQIRVPAANFPKSKFEEMWPRNSSGPRPHLLCYCVRFWTTHVNSHCMKQECMRV